MSVNLSVKNPDFAIPMAHAETAIAFRKPEKAWEYFRTLSSLLGEENSEELMQLQTKITLLDTEIEQEHAHAKKAGQSVRSFPPVGVNRPQGEQTCWMGALIQLVTNSPLLLENLLKKRETFQYLVPSLEKYLEADTASIEIDTKTIRAQFQEIGNTEQVDVADALIELINLAELDVPTFLLGIDGFDIPSDIIANELFLRVGQRFEGVKIEAPEHFFANGNYYAITGCAIHIGVDNNGHYTSIIRKTDGWYIVNDCTVDKVSQKDARELLKKGAIFQYRKEAPTWKAVALHTAYTIGKAFLNLALYAPKSLLGWNAKKLN